MNSSYLAVVVITLIIGVGAQAMIRSAYKKWSKVSISSGMTGAQAARRMLDDHGLSNVSVACTDGELSDHFDPRTNVVSLSKDVYNGRSVAATAVACHECGHAIQHAKSYVPAKIRASIVPVVNIASNIWIFALMAGIFLSMIGLIYVAIIMYLGVITFQLVTLPVEFDASKRALSYINVYGHLPANETTGARKVLRSAAMTYVAAALSSLLYLVYLLGLARR